MTPRKIIYMSYIFVGVEVDSNNISLFVKNIGINTGVNTALGNYMK